MTDPKAIDISPEAVAERACDTVEWLANRALVLSLLEWKSHSRNLLDCADQVDALSAALSEARGKVGEADQNAEAMEAKWRALAPHGTCACSVDSPEDVCLHHSPKLAAAIAERDSLRSKLAEAEREGDEAKAAAGQARADLFGTQDGALVRDLRALYERTCEERDAALSELAKLRAEAEWQPIETMPKGEEIFMAATVDGRIMIFRGSILASMMKCSTPGHLQFPAVAWKPLPSPPKDHAHD